jgi:hypothetical protein
MRDYALKIQLCMTASEVGENCWKTSLCNGTPSSVSAEIISKMKQLVRVDQRIAIGEVGCEVGVLYGSAWAVTTKELWISLVCAKFILQLLTDNRRECWNSCK